MQPAGEHFLADAGLALQQDGDGAAGGAAQQFERSLESGRGAGQGLVGGFAVEDERRCSRPMEYSINWPAKGWGAK